MIDNTVSGATCRPNFSAAGRKRRTMAAWVMGLATVGLFATALVLGAGVWWRALVAVPAMMTTITGLQVRRNTCVAHARMGPFEHEDFSTTKADERDLVESRKVAASIYRDGLLTGALVGLLGAGSAFLG